MKQFGDFYRGRRVLITGHTGFKGSWLALWLLQLGAEVAGFSIEVPSSPSNFELLGLKDRVRHYSGDVCQLGQLEQAIDEFQPEIIFHLAAQALVRRSYQDPRGTFETNVMGMVNVLELVRSRPFIKTAVLITSDKAYRNDEWCWGYRETDALGGHDPYSGSKSCADLVAQTYIHSYLRGAGKRVAITRAGNVIGGGDWASDRIVPDCIRAWTEGRSVEVRSPSATRPWQHVLEPLGAYLWLGASLQHDERINGEAFNFGPAAHVNQSVGELLDAMALRWPGAQWNSPANAGRPAHAEATLLKLSCDKALAYLDWRAVLDFSDTVEFTVDWYRNWYEGKQDMFTYALRQVEAYCDLAKAMGAKWLT